MLVCQWKPPRTVASSFTTAFNNFQKNQPSTSLFTSTIINSSEIHPIDNNIMSNSTPPSQGCNSTGGDIIKKGIIEHPELSESGEYFSHPTGDQKCYFGTDTFDSRKTSSETSGYVNNHNPTIHEVNFI